MVRAPTELSAEDIGGIADACRARRGEGAGFKPSEDVPGFPYRDVPGFCAAADLDAIRGHDHVLIPGQCVGSEPVEGDGEPLDEKIGRLTAGIGDWLYRPPGLQHRHDRTAGMSLPAAGSAVRSRLFRFLLAPMRGTAPAGTLVTWRGPGS